MKAEEHPRTFVVIGKTGAGKSTFASSLLMGKIIDDRSMIFEASASVNAATY